MARIGYKFMVMAAMAAAPGAWAQASLYNSNVPVASPMSINPAAMSLATANGFNPAALGQMNMGQMLGMSIAQQMMSGQFNPQALFSTLLQGAVTQMMPGSALNTAAIPGMGTTPQLGTMPGMTMPGMTSAPTTTGNPFLDMIKNILTGGMQGGTPSSASNFGGSTQTTYNPMTGQYTTTTTSSSPPYSSGLTNSSSSNNFGGYSGSTTGSSTSGDNNETATRAQKLNGTSGDKKVSAVYDATYNSEPDTDFKVSNSKWDSSYATAYAQYDAKNGNDPNTAFKVSGGKWDASYAKAYAQYDAKSSNGPNEEFKDSSGKWDAGYLAAYKSGLSATKLKAFEAELKAEEDAT